MMRLRAAAVALGIAVLWCLAGLSAGTRGRLVVYSSVGASAAVAAAFSREAGMPVTVVTMPAGALLARVSAEARHPHWDVLWFEGDDGALALDRAGLLAHGVAPALDWTAQGRTLLPSDGAYEVTSFTLAGIFLSRTGSGPAPRGWRDLTDGARLGMANPALSGPAYPLLAGMLDMNGGWPGGQAAILRMAARGLLIAPSNPSVLLALRTGRVSAGLVQSTVAFGLARRDSRYRITVPRPAIILPAIAAIAADRPAASRAIAGRFLRYIMRPDIQELRMHLSSSDRFFWPVTTVPRQPDLPDIGTISLLHPDPAIWGPRQAEVTGWFQQAVVR